MIVRIERQLAKYRHFTSYFAGWCKRLPNSNLAQPTGMPYSRFNFMSKRQIAGIALLICAPLIGFLIWHYKAGAERGLAARDEKYRAMLRLTTVEDAWESQSRELSGPHATDCGRVGVLGNPTVATECALKAFRERRPFRVRYDLQGIDSDVSAGLVYTPESKLYGLDFDGDPAGRGGTSLSRQRVEKVECPIPFHVYINPNGRLNCFSKQAVPPHSVMSPNLEPY